MKKVILSFVILSIGFTGALFYQSYKAGGIQHFLTKHVPVVADDRFNEENFVLPKMARTSNISNQFAETFQKILSVEHDIHTTGFGKNSIEVQNRLKAETARILYQWNLNDRIIEDVYRSINRQNRRYSKNTMEEIKNLLHISIKARQQWETSINNRLEAVKFENPKATDFIQKSSYWRQQLKKSHDSVKKIYANLHKINELEMTGFKN